ncbi:MAG: Rpn family recombination-promoting nuclease/putative transposase [Treponema sp.]|nr:Rpn family recombination-promoting nuclease/putative transposase [Treponema sp.]
MKTNRNFKDSVFTRLFTDPALLRDLYCALSGTDLPPDVPVSINTLDKVLYMDFNNDISFEIGGRLVVLIEHQSTINPNMALRFYMYHSRILEKIIENKNMYAEKKLSIPWPEFYVLYNGEKPYPDEKILKLSDLFDRPHDLGLPENAYPLLELEVKVLNINEGRNADIVNRCKELSEYSAFVSVERAFRKESKDRMEAINETVKYCHKHGILKEFLEKHGSEVLGMVLEEWNLEDAKEVWREEAREEERKEIARNLLAKGSTPEFISEITGLEIKDITEITI